MVVEKLCFTFSVLPSYQWQPCPIRIRVRLYGSVGPKVTFRPAKLILVHAQGELSYVLSCLQVIENYSKDGYGFVLAMILSVLMVYVSAS